MGNISIAHLPDTSPQEKKFRQRVYQLFFIFSFFMVVTFLVFGLFSSFRRIDKKHNEPFLFFILMKFFWFILALIIGCFNIQEIRKMSYDARYLANPGGLYIGSFVLFVSSILFLIRYFIGLISISGIFFLGLFLYVFVLFVFTSWFLCWYIYVEDIWYLLFIKFIIIIKYNY